MMCIVIAESKNEKKKMNGVKQNKKSAEKNINEGQKKKICERRNIKR